MKEIYLRFIALAHALEGTTAAVSTVDVTAKQLLNVIASNHAQDKTLTVTDAMALTSIASPATIARGRAPIKVLWVCLSNSCGTLNAVGS